MSQVTYLLAQLCQVVLEASHVAFDFLVRLAHLKKLHDEDCPLHPQPARDPCTPRRQPCRPELILVKVKVLTLRLEVIALPTMKT